MGKSKKLYYWEQGYLGEEMFVSKANKLREGIHTENKVIGAINCFGQRYDDNTIDSWLVYDDYKEIKDVLRILKIKYKLEVYNENNHSE